MLQNLIYRRLQYNRQTRQFFVTIAALGFTIDGVYAVLLNLYLLRLGYDTKFIGQLNSVGLIVFAVTGLPAGLLGARTTSKQMLRVGLGVMLLGTTLLPLSELGPSSWQGGWLMFSYALVLMGFALYFVNSAPFLMASVENGRQNSAFALQTALLSLAGFIGSIIGGNFPELIARLQNYTLDDPEPYRYTLMVVAFVIFAAFLVVLRIKDPVQQSAPQDDANISVPSINKANYTTAVISLIFLMSLIRFLQVAGVGTATVYFNVYMDTSLSLSPGTIGIIAAVGRLIAVPTALIAPRLIRRYGMGTIAVSASMITAILLLPLALIPHWLGAAFGYIGVVALSSLRFTAFIVYLMQLVPKDKQSVIAGAGEMAAGLSFAMMALGGGYILAAFSFRDLFLLGSGLTFMGTILFWAHLFYAKSR